MLKLIYTFYRRNVKSLLPSAIITMIIFSLVGISVISVTIPFNINLKNEIKDLDYQFSTTIAQDGMSLENLAYFFGYSLPLSLISVENSITNTNLLYQTFLLLLLTFTLTLLLQTPILQKKPI